MTTKTSLLSILACAFPFLSGCSSQDIYESGTSFRVQECERIPDAAKREECLTLARMSYKDYQQMKKERAR